VSRGDLHLLDWLVLALRDWRVVEHWRRVAKVAIHLCTQSLHSKSA
jgi:hypothetical protein